MDYQLLAQKLIEKKFEEAEEMSVKELDANKYNAQLWLYLGQALALQGYGASAMAVFNRAWILDPEAAWINKAKADLAKADLTSSKKGVDQLLLVKTVSVSAALIVKNEAEHIENCLKKIEASVDEIILVDTGSTDATVEIAEKFSKVKIVNFQWCDDFGAARNAAIPYITSEWVIWVDADEYLYEEDMEAVKEVAGIFDDLLVPVLLRVGVMCQNDDGSIFGRYGVTRMYRKKDNFKFFGRIHEQVVFDGRDIYDKGNTYSHAVRIRLLHHGYKLSVLKEKNKLERNIRLLEKTVDENKNDPAWLFFLGREYFNSGDFDRAFEVLSHCQEEAVKYPGFGRLLEVYILKAQILINRNNYSEAEEICNMALGLRADFPDALYLLAIIHVEKAYRLNKAAEDLVSGSKHSFESYRDIVSPDNSILEWKADLLLADILLYQGRMADAYGLYKKTLEISPMKEEILNKMKSIELERQKTIGN